MNQQKLYKRTGKNLPVTQHELFAKTFELLSNYDALSPKYRKTHNIQNPYASTIYVTLKNNTKVEVPENIRKIAIDERNKIKKSVLSTDNNDMEPHTRISQRKRYAANSHSNSNSKCENGNDCRNLPRDYEIVNDMMTGNFDYNDVDNVQGIDDFEESDIAANDTNEYIDNNIDNNINNDNNIDNNIDEEIDYQNYQNYQNCHNDNEYNEYNEYDEYNDNDDDNVDVDDYDILENYDNDDDNCDSVYKYYFYVLLIMVMLGFALGYYKYSKKY